MNAESVNNAGSLISELSSLQPIKTWSFLVTIFGDMHRAGMTTLSGTQLRDLLEPVGIRPEAVRVALHRLRKDGWISTEKLGRETQYSLSQHAIEETKTASIDVYRHDLKFSDGWCLAMFDTNELEIEVGIPISKQTWLVPKDSESTLRDPLISHFDKPSVPKWMMENIVSNSQLENADKLVALIAEVNAQTCGCSAGEALTLRMLILHHWRRMALRNETWLHIWLNEDGVLARCHREVQNVLEAMHHVQEPFLRPEPSALVER